MDKPSICFYLKAIRVQFTYDTIRKFIIPTGLNIAKKKLFIAVAKEVQNKVKCCYLM